MYLILIAWLYVTLMMAIAEASNPIGSVLGGIVTFVLYGLLPMSIVAYLMATPQRKRKLKAKREAEQAAWDAAQRAKNAETLPRPDVHAANLVAAQTAPQLHTPDTSGVTPSKH